MSVERRHRDFSLNPPASNRGGWRGSWYARWQSRWQLRLLNHRIATLEQQLADEFALLETAPLLEELAALRAERDRLQARLLDLT